MTSGEKSIFRTLAHFVVDGVDYSRVIKKVDTGSYVYQIVVEYKLGNGVTYYVIKTAKSGKRIGIIYIEKLSSFGLEYNYHIAGKLPDSVVGYINWHHRVFKHYMDYGEVGPEWE